MAVTLFSVNTQLSFTALTYKPCINTKVNLGRIVLTMPIQHSDPVFLFFLFFFPTQGKALSVSEMSIWTKVHGLAGTFLGCICGQSAACHRPQCYRHPKQGGRTRNKRREAAFPHCVSKARFETPNVVSNLILRWKPTWWKISLFYFAQSNSGLGFGTRSIIGSKCYLISPQMIFSFSYRWHSTLPSPTPNRCRTDRKSGSAFFRSHRDPVLLIFLFACVGYGCRPDAPISDVSQGQMVKRRVLIWNS